MLAPAEYRVAGVTFRRREALGVIRMCAEQTISVRLVAEPGNQYDHNAVRVEMRGQYAATSDQYGDSYDDVKGMAPDTRRDQWHHVGYIPRKVNAPIAARLAAGAILVAELVAYGTFDRDAKPGDDTPWFRIAVREQV